MIYKLRTSKETMKIFEELGISQGLQPFALSKIAIALSIRFGSLSDEDFSADTEGLELNTLWREELPMTEVDRDIALVLLKRLWKRELISEETYVSACNSRFFDKCRFTSDTKAMEEIMVEEADTHDDSSMVERADAAGQVNL